MAPEQKIGVLFVHGIGDPVRFYHLEEAASPIIKAIRRNNTDNSQLVEVTDQREALLDFESQPRAPGAVPPAPLKAVLKNQSSSERQTIEFDEVWWGDIHEPQSIGKTFRFWLWGIGIWLAAPLEFKSAAVNEPWKRKNLFTEANFRQKSGGSKIGRFYSDFARLYFACFFFAVVGVTVGLYNVIAARIFGNQYRVGNPLVQYLSALKLYQDTELAGAPIAKENEKPRYLVRARMAAKLVHMAARKYDRWYVVAHSLGTVVSFNGLMEPGHSLVNYLSQDDYVLAAYNGLLESGDQSLDVGDTAINAGSIEPRNANAATAWPNRPVDVPTTVALVRKNLFEKLAGYLTYGSPLDKYAGTWPQLVPINNDGVFAGSERFPLWYNVFDPLDPVAARLTAYGSPEDKGQGPRNILFSGSWMWLLAHLTYLRPSANGLPTLISKHLSTWIVEDKPDGLSTLRDASSEKKVRVKHNFLLTVMYAEWVIIAAIAVLATSFIINSLTGNTSFDGACQDCNLAVRQNWPAIADTSGWIVTIGLAMTTLLGILRYRLVGIDMTIYSGRAASSLGLLSGIVWWATNLIVWLGLAAVLLICFVPPDSWPACMKPLAIAPGDYGYWVQLTISLVSIVIALFLRTVAIDNHFTTEQSAETQGAPPPPPPPPSLSRNP